MKVLSHAAMLTVEIYLVEFLRNLHKQLLLSKVFLWVSLTIPTACVNTLSLVQTSMLIYRHYTSTVHWSSAYKLQNSVKNTIESIFKKVVRLNNMCYKNAVSPNNFPINFILFVKPIFTKKKKSFYIRNVCCSHYFLKHCWNQSFSIYRFFQRMLINFKDKWRL